MAQRPGLEMEFLTEVQRVLPLSVPEDVGKSPEEDAASPTVALRVREWVTRDACDCVVHRFSKFNAEAVTLTIVPVLDRGQVDLCRSTEDDGERQRGRCSRRALTSDQGL